MSGCSQPLVVKMADRDRDKVARRTQSAHQQYQPDQHRQQQRQQQFLPMPVAPLHGSHRRQQQYPYYRHEQPQRQLRHASSSPASRSEQAATQQSPAVSSATSAHPYGTQAGALNGQSPYANYSTSYYGQQQQQNLAGVEADSHAAYSGVPSYAAGTPSAPRGTRITPSDDGAAMVQRPTGSHPYTTRTQRPDRRPRAQHRRDRSPAPRAPIYSSCTCHESFRTWISPRCSRPSVPW